MCAQSVFLGEGLATPFVIAQERLFACVDALVLDKGASVLERAPAGAAQERFLARVDA